MEQGTRQVRFDRELGLEAYHFQGILQIFPGHFHDYYTVSFIERGLQHMVCRPVDGQVTAGDVILFHPGEVHACRPVDGQALDYRGLNIPTDTMGRTAAELGLDELPHFAAPLLRQSDLAPALRALHRMVMEGEPGLGKEESYLLLMGQLLARHGAPPTEAPPPGTVGRACAWLEAHCTQRVGLDELADFSGWDKYRLIRAFTREKGITPYSYLITLRVNRAKALLEAGQTVLEAALATGFSDQSHLTHAFKRLIGLTPGQYGSIFAQGEVPHDPD